jgi:hypothetical protein
VVELSRSASIKTAVVMVFLQESNLTVFILEFTFFANKFFFHN